jgi:hypothetical protein
VERYPQLNHQITKELFVDQITFEGTVPDTFSNQSEFRIKIAEKDINRVIAFIEKTDTTYRTGGFPVRNKEYVRQCKAGDYIQIQNS